MSYNLTNQAIEDSFQPLLQIDSGSSLRDGTGSLVDNINVTSSYALTASFAENVIPTDTGSLLTTASFNNGTRNLTFTKGDNSTFNVNIPSESGSVDWTDVTNKPSGLVSGSSQLTASYDQRYTLSGSVQPLPSGLVSGSSQIDFGGITGVPSGLVSSSTQISFNGITDKPTLVSGSSQIDLSQTFGTASHAISASYAVSASYEIIKEISSSYADFAPYDGILNKPTLVSGSSQIILQDTTGNLSGSRINGAVTESISSSYSSTSEWNGLIQKPSGLVSGSSQVVLEDTTFTDNGEFSFLQTDGAGNLSFQYVESINDIVYAGENISKTDPLYVSGSQGANPTVYKADAADPNKAAIYIAAENITQGSTGRGILLGGIDAVDLTGIPAGTTVYLGEGGGWSITRPSGSNSLVQSLGIVTKTGSGGKGEILNPGPATLPNLQSGYAWVGDGGNQPQQVSTSSIQTDISGLVTTSSFNQYTSSTDARLNSIELETSSLDTRVTNLETFSSSLDNDFVSETEFGIYTASNDSKVNSLIASTGSYATTGSNTFNGDQTVSGSVYVSQSLYFKSDETSSFTSNAIIFQGGQTRMVQPKNDPFSFISERGMFFSSTGNNAEVNFATDGNNSNILFRAQNGGAIFLTGSAGIDIKGNTVITGSVTSTINKSNTHLNPKVITDNVIIPTGQNGLVIGETTIAGDYTIEGDSEVYVFTEPDLDGYLTDAEFTPISASFDSRINAIDVNTASLATTGSNTFNGNQTINGDIYVTGSSLILSGSNIELAASNTFTIRNINPTNTPIKFNSNLEFNGAVQFNTSIYNNPSFQSSATNIGLNNINDDYVITLNSGSETLLGTTALVGFGDSTREVRLVIKQPLDGIGSLRLNNSDGFTLAGPSGSIQPNFGLTVSQVTGSVDYIELQSSREYIIIKTNLYNLEQQS
jgi:hypothetical protein